MNERVPETISASDVNDAVRAEMERWERLLSPVLTMRRGITAALRAISGRARTPYKTVVKKFYALKHRGPAGLCDLRRAGARFWKSGPTTNFLSRADKWLLRIYCLAYGHPATAIAELRADWKAARITTRTAIEKRTGFPRGWSVENLRRHVPQLAQTPGSREMEFKVEITVPGAKPVSLRFVPEPAKLK